jgi:hypothetical protein
VDDRVGGLFEYFLVAITGMFGIINPLTTAFVFASLRDALG